MYQNNNYDTWTILDWLIYGAGGRESHMWRVKRFKDTQTEGVIEKERGEKDKEIEEIVKCGRQGGGGE
jgi:hypothetical protein